MELEELKKLWSSLDERLNRQEILKESIIREMIYAKSNKSLSKLLNMEVLGAVICLLVIPYLLFVYVNGHPDLWIEKIVICFGVFISVASVIWKLIKIRPLLKVDFIKSVSHNVLYINKYNIFTQKEKIARAIIFVIIIALFICLFAIACADIIIWIASVCAFLFGIAFTYYRYKVFFDKNIASIQKSLDELKELEDETD
jgi:hypothetical protein